MRSRTVAGASQFVWGVSGGRSCRRNECSGWSSMKHEEDDNEEEEEEEEEEGEEEAVPAP